MPIRSQAMPLLQRRCDSQRSGAARAAGPLPALRCAPRRRPAITITCTSAPPHHEEHGVATSKSGYEGSSGSNGNNGSSSGSSSGSSTDGGSGGTAGGKLLAKLPTPKPLASVDEDASELVFLSSSDEAPFEGLDRDQFKEDSRRHFRTVFDHNRWAAHRSTQRYVRHLMGMFKSRMVHGLAAPLLYILGLSTAICAGHEAAEAGMVPQLAVAFNVHGTEPFALTSFALSLLLVFRTNASYSRWLDARKNWGTVINRSRDLVRQGITYVPREERVLLDLLARWTVAFSRSLMAHLRCDVDAEAELRRVLRPAEAESALAADHRPAYCLQVLSEIIKEAQQGQAPATAAASRAAAKASAPRMPSGAGLRMDENLTALEDMVGGCERILRTPIPLSYTRHTSRFMIVFLSLLPIGLWDSCRWATVPICCIISFLLLGIEEIGVAIEEPFSILPLEAICDVLEKNVWELHRTHVEGPSSGGAGANGRQPLLTASGVVQAAKLAEE